MRDPRQWGACWLADRVGSAGVGPVLGAALAAEPERDACLRGAEGYTGDTPRPRTSCHGQPRATLVSGADKDVCCMTLGDPPFDDKRRFGYSRDKRSDCVQVVTPDCDGFRRDAGQRRATLAGFLPAIRPVRSGLINVARALKGRLTRQAFLAQSHGDHESLPPATRHLKPALHDRDQLLKLGAGGPGRWSTSACPPPAITPETFVRLCGTGSGRPAGGRAATCCARTCDGPRDALAYMQLTDRTGLQGAQTTSRSARSSISAKPGSSAPLVSFIAYCLHVTRGPHAPGLRRRFSDGRCASATTAQLVLPHPAETGSSTTCCYTNSSCN